MLIGIAFPALCAVVLYLVGGLQLIGSHIPARPAQFDLALTPNNQPTVKNTAQLLFSLTAGRPPDERSARYAYDNVLASLRDSSPEASVLRAAGRRLYQAGLNHDAAEWAAAVAQICALAGHC
jgi:hypothetical protein